MFTKGKGSDISQDEGQHLVLDAVRRCGSEAQRSGDRKLQCVGGTHAAHLGFAGPALARRLGPVCLESLGKGTDQRQGKGPQDSLHGFWGSGAHVRLWARTQRNAEHMGSLGSYWLRSTSLLPLFQSFCVSAVKAMLAKHLAVGKVGSSLQPNAERETMHGYYNKAWSVSRMWGCTTASGSS